jgi:hypothetical protein
LPHDRSFERRASTRSLATEYLIDPVGVDKIDDTGKR